MKRLHIELLNMDVEKIKSQARESLEAGAVTKDYSLNLDEACQLLNEALATEIMCMLRYRRHQIIAKGINRLEVAGEFKEHAEQEEQHMLMIAERINQLGGEPDFNPANADKKSIADYGSANNLMGMIRENLIAERVVITVYRKMIAWFGDKDPTTRRVLEVILEDEEEHADDLADLLATQGS